MEHNANGGRQHNTAHALLISHAHSADVVSRNMMNMAYARSWQAIIMIMTVIIIIIIITYYYYGRPMSQQQLLGCCALEGAACKSYYIQ